MSAVSEWFMVRGGVVALGPKDSLSPGPLPITVHRRVFFECVNYYGLEALIKFNDYNI